MDTSKKYGRYFLAFEAPGDEENPDMNPEVTVVPEENIDVPAEEIPEEQPVEDQGDDVIKDNTKVITVRPSKMRKDFTDGIEDLQLPEENELPVEGDELGDTENLSVNPDTAPSVSIDGNDVELNTDDIELDEDPLVSQINDVNDQITADGNANLDTMQNPGMDQPMDATDPNAMGGTDDIALDDGAGMIDTPDAGMDGMDAGMGDQGMNPMDPNAQAKKGPGIEYDSVRKYVLFNKFQDLLTSIDGYIEKLENSNVDDINTNKVYTTAIKELDAIKDVTKDYLLMRFELSSYIASLLFYQERITALYKTFGIIKYSLDMIAKKNVSNK